MPATTEQRSRPLRLEDPQLQQLADRVLHTMQLAAEKAVLHLAAPNDYPMPIARRSAEKIFLNRLRQRPVAKQQAALTQVQARTDAERRAQYGDLARIDLRSAIPVAEQVDAIPSRVRLSMEQLPEPPASPKSSSHATLFTGVRLRLHKMVCVDETDGLFGNEGGSDEILLGGVAIDASGKVHKIKTFTVGTNFDDGDTRTFAPPRTFASFAFSDSDTVTMDGETHTVGWPKTFKVTFVLAEEDNGGFPDFIQELYELAEEYVVKEVAAAVGAAIGGAVGNAIGAAVGAVVGWVMGTLADVLIDLWEDDVFVPLTASLTLPGPTHQWNGQADSPNTAKAWKGHGGHYRLHFDWQMDGGINLEELHGAMPFNVGAVAWHATTDRKRRIDVFARGDDRKIYQCFEQEAGWSTWAPNMGAGTFTSGPASVSWGRNRLDVFASGDDRRIWHTFWAGNGWSGWGPVGVGTFTSGPAAASWGPGRLDVFARGDDHKIYHLWQQDGGWSWGPIGNGTFDSGPAAVSWGPNRLDVFAIGKDKRMYHASWNGGWSGWSAVGGGTFTSGPAAASWAADRLDVFARGGDHRIYHASWNGSGWSGWGAIGIGTFDSGPAAVSVAFNRLDVFAVGKDRRMRRAAWNGKSWAGWFDDMGAGTFS